MESKQASLRQFGMEPYPDEEPEGNIHPEPDEKQSEITDWMEN